MSISKELNNIHNIKSRLSLAYVVCIMYPDLYPNLDQAVDATIGAALPRLEGLASHYLSKNGRHLSSLAGDVVANWLIRICEAGLAGKFDPRRGKPLAYFGRVMRLVALESIRSMAREITNAEAIDSCVETKPSVIDELTRAEALDLARKRYLELPPRQKLAVKRIFPFLDPEDDEPLGGAPAEPGDPPSPLPPSYASASRGRKSVIRHVQNLTV